MYTLMRVEISAFLVSSETGARTDVERLLVVVPLMAAVPNPDPGLVAVISCPQGSMLIC